MYAMYAMLCDLLYCTFIGFGARKTLPHTYKIPVYKWYLLPAHLTSKKTVGRQGWSSPLGRRFGTQYLLLTGLPKTADFDQFKYCFNS